MLICHTSSPKCKVRNLKISNSVGCSYLPAYWLSNPKLHQLLTLGKLPTSALPKRLHLIFLWEEFPRRVPIPIVNILLDTVCIFVWIWIAHSYLDLPKNNKEKDFFRNRLLSLFWLVYNMMKTWKFFGRINYECSLTYIVDRYWHVFFLTWWPTNIKWRMVM